MTRTERIREIDAMRFIGISLIILAHILGPGSLLFQIRSFDVPLMLFVSGLVSARRPVNDYGKYIGHRFLRLMVPVWLFYTLYFLILYLGSRSGLCSFPSWQEIGRTYLCLDGYGWIIRIFLLVMLVSPLLVSLEQAVKNPALYLAIMTGFILLTALLVPVFKGRDGWLVKDLWEGCFLSLLGYIPAFMAGLRMKTAATRERVLFAVVFTAASLVIFLIPGIPFDLEYFKRPPQFPYITYGIAVSCLIWLCQPLLRLLSRVRPLLFIGRNTIWIYLWHVLALAFVFMITDNWVLQYVIVYLTAVVLFLPQYFLAQRARKEGSSFAQYLIG